MSDDNLSWLSAWYLSQCNEDWEHSYGIEIGTLDNPGWTVAIDLNQTSLEGSPFQKVSVGSAASDIAQWRRLGSWWVADVSAGKFKAACGPLDLGNVIGVFRAWVEQADVC